jgi:predicted DNA-binding protein with PD1-like motif
MKVFEGKQGRAFACRLDYEADLLDSFKQLAEERKIDAAAFFMLGAVKKAKICVYDQKKKKYMDDITLEGPLEVISCSGNIAKFKGKIMVHAHVVFSDVKGKAFGGHLLPGTVVFAGEVFMIELKGISLIREYDPVTGLNLFK